MVKKVEVYQCEECGFHYEIEKRAKECEDWCKANHTCNIEITKDAIESK